jgi:hypothetical protein
MSDEQRIAISAVRIFWSCPSFFYFQPLCSNSSRMKIRTGRLKVGRHAAGWHVCALGSGEINDPAFRIHRKNYPNKQAVRVHGEGLICDPILSRANDDRERKKVNDREKHHSNQTESDHKKIPPIMIHSKLNTEKVVDGAAPLTNCLAIRTR